MIGKKRDNPTRRWMLKLSSLFNDIHRRLLRTSQGPPLDRLYQANHIQRTFNVDFETFRADPGRYLFALPPDLQALWARGHTLLPLQRRIADRYASATRPLAKNSPDATLGHEQPRSPRQSRAHRNRRRR
jgi:hypothetical protein